MSEETDLMEKIEALQEEQIAADKRVIKILKALVLIFVLGMVIIQLAGCDEDKYNPLIFPYYTQPHYFIA